MDYSAPQITVLSPVNGTYRTGVVDLNFTVSEPVSWIKYSLDGQENVTVTGNTTLMGLSEGGHHVTFYAKDYANNTGSSGSVCFAVDVTPPTVSLLSPVNDTYQDADVWLNFTVTKPVSWMGYSLDGAANVTVTGNFTLSGLSSGTHHLTVYANDTAGNMGASTGVYFLVEGSNPSPSEGVDLVPVLLVGLVVLAVALVGVVYTLKISS